MKVGYSCTPWSHQDQSCVIFLDFRGATLDIQGGHGSLGLAKFSFLTPQPGEVVFLPFYVCFYNWVGWVKFIFTHQLGKVFIFLSKKLPPLLNIKWSTPYRRWTWRCVWRWLCLVCSVLWNKIWIWFWYDSLYFVTGERRIRVHTMCLPVTNQLSEVMAAADQQAIVCLLSRMGELELL